MKNRIMAGRYPLWVVCVIVTGLLLWTATAYAVGTVTQELTRNNRTHVNTLVYTWTGDSGNGSVPATASNSSIDGYVFLVTTNPGGTAPTDDYDITLTDADGVDIMGGELANRDETNSEQAVPKIDTVYGSRYVSGKLTMTLTNNTVHSAVGTVTVYSYDK